MFKRHGDVLIGEVKKVEGEVVKHNGSFVLAEGETTGHKHVITVPKIDDMEVRRDAFGGVYLTLRAEGTITHEEHKTLKIRPGVYRIGKEREIDWFAQGIERKVID